MKKILFILGVLNNDDLDWIIRHGRTENIHPGMILIQEGQLIDALYIVLKGTLSVVTEAMGDRALAQISSGEVVGEVSFVDSRPPLATVRAIEESLVLSIPRLQLTAKLQQDVGFASRFYHAVSLCLADRMRGTIRRLGYDFEPGVPEDEMKDMNPRVLDHLELAQTKFNWLLQSVGVKHP